MVNLKSKSESTDDLYKNLSNKLENVVVKNGDILVLLLLAMKCPSTFPIHSIISVSRTVYHLKLIYNREQCYYRVRFTRTIIF